MGRGFRSKLDAMALPVMLAFRAVRRVVRPVARCKIGRLSIAIRISTPNEHHRADTYATKEPETIEWLRANLEVTWPDERTGIALQPAKERLN